MILTGGTHCPPSRATILSVHTTTMNRFPLSQATSLSDRTIVWVSAADNAKNGDGRPSQYVHWGVPAATIAAQYSEAHRTDSRQAQWG